MATRAETKKKQASNKPTQPKTIGGRINRMLNPTPGQSSMKTPTDATRASDIKALKNFAKGAGVLGIAVTAYDYVDGMYKKYKKEKDAEKKREIMREVRGKVMSETKLAKGGALKKAPADAKGLKKLPTNVRNKMGYMAKGGTVKGFKPCAGCTSPKTCAKSGCKKKKSK